MTDMVKNVKFKSDLDNLQKKYKTQEKIQNCNKVFIFADKTTTINTIEPRIHKNLISNNITQLYNKTTENKKRSI